MTVFAAASLTDAMKDIAAAWQKAGHSPLRLSLGASSTLARQIQQGAPANVFASADQTWMDFLDKAGLLAAGTRRDLLSNSLVLIKVKTRLAPTPDVRAGLLLVSRGEAPTGVVYGTDAAVSPDVRTAGIFPENTHDPITYPFAIVKAGAMPEASALLAFLAEPEARSIFLARGFTVPE